MSAHADDLRYFYSGVLGRAQTFAVTDAGSTKHAEALTPGRYLVHPIDLTGRVWIRQGPFDSVAASAAAPSFPLDANGIRAVEITVRPGAVVDGAAQPSADAGVAAIGAAGASCTLVITKISRGER